MAHTFNPSTREAETGASPKMRPAWSGVLGWPVLHGETISGEIQGVRAVWTTDARCGSRHLSSPCSRGWNRKIYNWFKASLGCMARLFLKNKNKSLTNSSTFNIFIVSSDYAFSKAFLNKNLYQVFSHCWHLGEWTYEKLSEDEATTCYSQVSFALPSIGTCANEDISSSQTCSSDKHVFWNSYTM